MSISTRYRELESDVTDLSRKLAALEPPVPPRALRQMEKARGRFAEIIEVGDVPIRKLERELTPVLLEAHRDLDEARMELEQAGFAPQGGKVWELEQGIYRLLNSL